MSDYEDDYIPDAQETPQEAPERQERAAEPDYESEARRQGWKPQEEFDGPAEKWRPAKDFVERGNEDPKILRSRVDKLDRALNEVRRQAREERDQLQRASEERIERLARQQVQALRQQRDAYEQQIEAAKRAAVREGDEQRYEDLTKHQREVRAEWRKEDEDTAPAAKPQSQAPVIAEPAQETKAWVQRNAWFQKDQALTDEAIAYENYLAQSRPGMSIEERLEETRAHVVKTFPHKFGKKPVTTQPPRQGGSPVEGSQRASGPASAADGGFGKLPQEARAQFKSFVKEGVFKDDDASRAKYAKYYNEPNFDKQQKS